MLRRVTNAGFQKTGSWFSKRYYFQAGDSRTKRALTKDELQVVLVAQASQPLVVMTDVANRRTWWMFQGEFYWEDEGYDAREVKALILDRERKKERRVERAVTLMEQGPPAGVERRESISDEVRAFVWNRDGRKCVSCGSQQSLEFDHIIPVAKGGSSTARNLQLLCEICNRSKGDAIA